MGRWGGWGDGEMGRWGKFLLSDAAREQGSQCRQRGFPRRRNLR
ncbi:hypothetical protein [Moorena producens]|nr:hypothetical protein [Moorena producens]